jgi:Holliday junction resolvasome RuvABC DNA-binding subunit
MIHYFVGMIQSVGQTTYLTNEHRGIETLYEWKQSEGQFFLVSQIDQHSGFIKYYAFDTIEQKSMFHTLLKIQWIGGRSAYTLTMRDPILLSDAIEHFDLGYFQSIPGIGPKTAKRILIDLKTELTAQETSKLSQDDKILRDIITSLTNLWYDRKLVKETLLQYPHHIEHSELPTVIQWVIDKM